MCELVIIYATDVFNIYVTQLRRRAAVRERSATAAFCRKEESRFMLSTAISAVSYADIAFFVLVGLGLLGGLIGGLAKSFKGFYKSIAVILVSLLLVGVTLAPVCKIGFVDGLKQNLAQKTANWGIVFTEPIHIAEDGSFYINVEFDGTMNKVKLEDAGGSGLVDRTKAKLAVWLAERFVTEDGQTLGDAGAGALTSLIVAVVLFILYSIALAIICSLLRRAFKNMHSADSPAVRAVDRTLGALLSASLALVFILLVLAILHTLADTLPAMHEYLLNSPVVGYLYENNPIGSVFKSIFG